ncbi:MAG TPA: ABC transporter permease [Thermodesulfovibrionales bacterium]|nr:ABC transporter permease [Thermodesulfovibrionales bacterium]
MVAAVHEFLEIARYKEFLRNLVIRDIKVRYKRSFLGFLWVMLNPLLMMLIMNMVFSGLFKVSTQNYTAYLLSGIILWNFFSQSTTTAVLSLLSNSNLIKKIYIPKSVFPLSVIVSAVINFLFSLIPLFLIFYLTGTPLSPFVYLVPVIILLSGIFSFGISLILSTLTVFFHDTKYIYDVLLLGWMYATPIFYPEAIIPEKYVFLLHMNPLYYFISAFRGALYMDIPSFFTKLLYGSLFSIAALTVGWFLYSRYKDRVVYYL